MEFVIQVPDNRYYLWQMLVQIAHLRELGYEQDAHYLIIYFDQPSEILQRLFDSEALAATSTPTPTRVRTAATAPA